LTLGTKLAVFLTLALVFGATMVALSLRTHASREYASNESPNQKNFDKTFSVGPGGKLVIKADEGSISVTGTNRSDVSVHVRARGADSRLAKFDVTIDQSGSTVRAETRYRHSFMNLFGDDNIEVEFEVEVPEKFNLDLNTAGGDITILNVSGTTRGETSGGDLDLSKLDGPVDLTTSGGNVTLSDSKGDFRIGTSGGNVRAESIAGSMDFESSGGNIDVKESDGKLRASTSGGDVRVELRDNKGIDLQTSGGSLVVRLPKSISAEVLAETTGGDVNCDFQFSGKLREGSMKGKINGGGNLIKLETSGGDIVINSQE
jgi:DUF4097 and DUF4098 domain-containing protein YvlB